MDLKPAKEEVVSSSNRMIGVAAGRGFAIFVVVCVHTNNGPYSSIIQDGLGRFAVPFFFVAAGYFLGQGVLKRGCRLQLSRSVKRIVLAYLAWSLVYLPFWLLIQRRSYSGVRGWDWVLSSLSSLFPFDWLRGGTHFHLWFFPSLAMCSIWVVLLWKTVRVEFGLIVVLSLYVWAALSMGYHGTPLGSSFPFGNPRDFIFFGGLPLWIGFHLGVNSFSIIYRRVWLFVAFFVAIAFHLLEMYVSHEMYSGDGPYDAFVTTFAGGVLFFLICMHPDSQKNSFLNRFWASAGNVSLGIYAVHMLFAYLLVYRVFPHDGSIQVPFLRPALVFFMSWLVSLVFARVAILRPMFR